MFDHAVYNLLKNKGWKNQSFLISGTFTAPISGVYYISGTGGGGGGNSAGGGGAGGAACDMAQVFLSKGDIVTVTIAAGGAINGAGGTTSFGTYISLPGGSSGPPNSANAISSGGLRSFFSSAFSGAASSDAITMGSFISGASVFVTSSGVYLYGNSRYIKAAGHAAGYFGTSGDNTGAGGNPNTSGYSGYLEVLWQE